MIYNTMYVARDSEAIYTPHLAILIDSLITAERPERGSCEHSLPSSVEAGEFTVDHFKCSRLVHHLPLRADKLAVVKTTLKSSSGEYHVQASRTSCFFFGSKRQQGYHGRDPRSDWPSPDGGGGWENQLHGVCPAQVSNANVR